MDRPQLARRGLPSGHGNPSQHVAVEMHRAALAAGPGEHLLERAEHPRALVAGDKPHAGEAAPPELGEELARSVHFGHGGHEGSVDVLVELELVRGEKLPMRSLGCAA